MDRTDAGIGRRLMQAPREINGPAPANDQDRGVPEVPEYRLLRSIGRGGAGEVWLAQHLVQREFRAVKLVRRMDERAYQRERKGLQVFGPISTRHVGLMDVLTVAEIADQWLYAVFELADDLADPVAEVQLKPGSLPGPENEVSSLEGAPDSEHSPIRPVFAGIDGYIPMTLASWVERRGRLRVEEALVLGIRLTDALGFLNEQGLVHRDIKPSNIIFVGSQPKLSDPGSVADVDGTHTRIISSGFTPELGAGTKSADLYSLGKVIYYAATGRQPRDVAELPTCSLPDDERLGFAELQEVLFRACAAVPERRYPTAAAMRRDLERLREGESLRNERRRRQRGKYAFVGILAAGVTALLLAFAWRHEVGRNRMIVELADQNQKQLLDVHMANGFQEMKNGALLAAATWFGEALKSTRSPREESLLRHRIQSCLLLSPNLERRGRHQGAVNEANFSRDGTRFVTVSADRTARIWDTQSGTEVVPAMQHDAEVNVGHFSPDGTRLVTGCEDGTVWIWDATRGRRLQGPLTTGRQVTTAFFSPDGRRVVVADRGGEARVLDAVTGELAFPPLEHVPKPRDSQQVMDHAEFSFDGRWILTSGEIRKGVGEARIWDAATGKLHRRFPNESSAIGYAGFSRDGKSFALGTDAGIAQVWETESGLRFGPPIHHVHLQFVSFSPDGRRLLTAGGAPGGLGEARVWDIASGQADTVPIRHAGRIRHAAFSADGRWVATASLDASVQLLDTATHESSLVVLPHQQFVWSVEFSPDGRHLLTAGQENIWRLWSFEPRREGVDELTLGQGWVDSSPVVRGRTLWTTFNGHPDLAVWNLREPKLLKTHRFPEGLGVLVANSAYTEVLLSTARGEAEIWRFDPPERIRSIAPLPASIAQAAKSKSGHRFAALYQLHGPRKTAAWQLWNGDTLSPVGEVVVLDRDWPQGRAIAMNGEGNLVAVAASIKNDFDRGLLVVFNAETRRPAWAPVEMPGIPSRVDFSPNGDWLVAGCGSSRGDSRSISLYNARTGQTSGQPMPHIAGIGSVAFSPDGGYLATGDTHGFLYIWRIPQVELQTRNRVAHRQGIVSLAWSSDSRRIATGSADHTARIWDPYNGEPMSPPLPHGHELGSVTFTPDDELLITGSKDRVLRTWQLSPALGPVPELQSRIERASGLRVRAGVLSPLPEE